MRLINFNSKYLIAQRLNKGLTQSELAILLRTSHQHISVWETNKSNPSAKYIDKLVTILNLDRSQLFKEAA